MTEKNLDMAHKELTWDRFVKLTQWSVVLVVVTLILMAFFLV